MEEKEAENTGKIKELEKQNKQEFDINTFLNLAEKLRKISEKADKPKIKTIKHARIKKTKKKFKRKIAIKIKNKEKGHKKQKQELKANRRRKTKDKHKRKKR